MHRVGMLLGTDAFCGILEEYCVLACLEILYTSLARTSDTDDSSKFASGFKEKVAYIWHSHRLMREAGRSSHLSSC